MTQTLKTVALFLVTLAATWLVMDWVNAQIGWFVR